MDCRSLMGWQSIGSEQINAATQNRTVLMPYQEE